jgi:hypothetical protein
MPPGVFFFLVILQEGPQVFAPGWPQTLILLPMASHVAGTTGTTSHHAPFIEMEGYLFAQSGLELKSHRSLCYELLELQV